MLRVPGLQFSVLSQVKFLIDSSVVVAAATKSLSNTKVEPLWDGPRAPPGVFPRERVGSGTRLGVPFVPLVPFRVLLIP